MYKGSGILNTTTNVQIIFIGLLLLLMLSGCSSEAPPAPVLEELRDDGPSKESWDVAFRVSENGLARMEIQAGYMGQYERGDTLYTLLEPGLEREQVSAVIFSAAGTPSATMTADRLRYFEKERTLEARGRVVVVADPGKRLETEHLVWLEKDRKIHTPGFVRITTSEEKIQGYRLVADEDLENYSLAQVTGQVIVEEEE